MNSFIRTKTSANLEQEQLKLKLEQYRGSNKPQKSSLKPSGSIAAAPAIKDGNLHLNENTHPVLPITPKFRASDSNALKSRSRPKEPSAVAAECHLQAILQKVLTDANSLANIGKIQEVIWNDHLSSQRFLTLQQAIEVVDQTILSDLKHEV